MEQQVIITTDLGYGDAGKGTMVDAIVHEQNIDLVVRYSGGAQAAHNVVTPDGRHHTFAQFGSGSFRTGTKTFLGPKVLVQPQLLLAEAAALETKQVRNAFGHIAIDYRAPIITPYHQLTNQLKELARGTSRHGSTGIGIGETRADSERSVGQYLSAGDLLSPGIARQKLSEIRERKKADTLALLQANASNQAMINVWHQFADATLFESTLASYQTVAMNIQITDASFLQDHLRSGNRVVFEAAQGTLLDEDYGFFPYVTRGKVRTVHAYELLAEIGHHQSPYVLGITRAYAARHGPGPLPTENAWLRSQIHEQHNTHGDWQGAFRMGHFDAVATDYAIRANGKVDALAVTSIDQLQQHDSFYYADQYHDATGNEYRQLDLPELGNLAELTALSNWLLQGVSPIYQERTMSTGSVIDLISERLATPIVAISEGITRSEKLFFLPAARNAA